jgi:arylsulfatase
MRFSMNCVRLAITAIFAGLLLAGSPLRAASGAPRPNIIIIMADDMGYSDAGFMGSEIDTPNLNHLAKEGVLFTQFYNTSRCCPTRASLMTGLYPHQAGMGHMNWQQFDLPGYQAQISFHTPTIAEVLKPAGYETYMSGKWHLTLEDAADSPRDDWPRQRGFDHYYGTIIGSGSYFDPQMLVRENTVITPSTDPEYHPEKFYYTDAIADQSIRDIKEHHQQSPDKPFFLYVAFTSPHWPLHALESDIAKYKGKYDGGFKPIREARYKKEKELGIIDPNWELSPQNQAWSDVKHPKWEARCMEVYAAQIDRMDQNIGKIIDALKSTGQLDNTLLFFLQDNGACAETTGRGPKPPRKGMHGGPKYMPGPADTFIAYGKSWANVSDTPFKEYKHFVHEGGISTPLIAHWPAGIKRQGVMERQPGHLIDIMATCIDVSGAQFPKEFAGGKTTPLPGVSLVPAFDGKPLGRQSPLFFEHEGNRAMRDGKWKIVATGQKAPWELYDMQSDRSEMHDLASQYPDRVKEMSDQWQAWAKASQVLPMEPWKTLKPIAIEARRQPGHQ